MVPRPPEVIQRFGCSKPKCCAAHIWCWPTSVVMNTSFDCARVSSCRRRIAYCGLMIAPFCMSWVKRRLSLPRHSSICRHQAASAARSGTAASACHAAASSAIARPASPMIATSTGTVLLMLDGSISIWIFRAPGQNAFSRPVTRSSNRAPIASSTSASCIARLASYVPCMPSMPRNCGSEAGNVPSPIRVLVQGNPVARTKRVSAAEASGPAFTTPPPTYTTGRFASRSKATARRICAGSGSVRGR